MPKSVASYLSLASNHDVEEDEIGERQAEAMRNSYLNAYGGQSTPVSPVESRRTVRPRISDLMLRRGPSQIDLPSESTPLLLRPDLPSDYSSRFNSSPGTPRRTAGSRVRNHSRHPSSSFGLRLARTFSTAEGSIYERHGVHSSNNPINYHDRFWYDQFTSTDWVHDIIADTHRSKELRSGKDWRSRVKASLDGAQGWILVAIIGILTACVTYFINVTEAVLFDYKLGYCHERWWLTKRNCCSGANTCDEWRSWSTVVRTENDDKTWAEFAVFLGWVVLFSLISCCITFLTKTTISSAVSLSTLDENLGAEQHSKSQTEGQTEDFARHPPVTYYPAAGSGVAEVKVILSGFVLHGYLGLRTLICKTFGLIFSVASGLSLGKEGPYVHIATCIGNISSRFVPKYKENDGKRREILSASAAAGVAVAFGAPLAGVLFSLEEVSYYFPRKTLFRTFFCCIAAALSLRFLNPYGTGKIVLFEVRYLIDWKFFEIIAFILLGMLGGLIGALFIKASRLWAKTFRRIPIIKQYPIVEVLLVAIATGVFSFWNRYTRVPVAELLFELASPCDTFSDDGTNLCPTRENIFDVIWYLFIAFVVKAALTTVTFGIKVPAGIYVPSMVVGGLLGRIVGHFVQWLILSYPDAWLFASCPASEGQPEACVVPGVYALVAAGATMSGVTRLQVTLAVILFELTGSLEHVLPFSLGVLFAKWTADALEPLSIYDLLTDMNAYPYLDSKDRPIFATDLGDITPHLDADHMIDISVSPLVSAKDLRAKVQHLHVSGELDGGLPILQDRILVGLIPGPDLEFALDRLEEEENTLCLMSAQHYWQRSLSVVTPGSNPYFAGPDATHDEDPQRIVNRDTADRTDFTPYIDPAPVALDIGSSMDLVFECFVKLGLRYICVLRKGKFVGMIHKKAFVRYVKQVEREST